VERRIILMSPVEHLKFIYITLAIIVAATTIYYTLKKGFVSAMKGKFMALEEKENLMTDEKFEKNCERKQFGCATEICLKINDVSTSLAIFEHDMQEIKNKVDDNLKTVKERIEGVTDTVDNLRSSMETELKTIAKFMGSVETWIKKSNGG